MPRIIKQQAEAEGNISFECLIPDNFPELFADGISSLQVGMPISRLIFHAVTEPSVDGSPEQRVAKLSLVIPTATLFEFIANVAAASTDETVQSSNIAAAQYIQQFSVQLSRLTELRTGPAPSKA